MPVNNITFMPGILNFMDPLADIFKEMKHNTNKVYNTTFLLFAFPSFFFFIIVLFGDKSLLLIKKTSSAKNFYIFYRKEGFSVYSF